jgi:hypothetical protein
VRPLYHPQQYHSFPLLALSLCVGLDRFHGFVAVRLLPRPTPKRVDQWLHLAWLLPFDLTLIGNYAPASIALRTIGTSKHRRPWLAFWQACTENIPCRCLLRGAYGQDFFFKGEVAARKCAYTLTYRPFYFHSSPWYVRNSDLHRDLNVEPVTDIIKKMTQNHERRLHNHPNTEAIKLLNYREATRRLNRTLEHWNC